MKYLIVTLIKGDAKVYQETLREHIANKFHVNGAIKRLSPAHITLKYSFFLDDITPIENLIKSFCLKNHKCDYELKGINNFDKNVLYIDVLPSKQMLELYSRFISELQMKSNLPFKQFDGTTHFHSTIAQEDIFDKFQDIQKYLFTKNPSFKVVLDNITLLSLENEVWTIYKEFPLL